MIIQTTNNTDGSQTVTAKCDDCGKIETYTVHKDIVTMMSMMDCDGSNAYRCEPCQIKHIVAIRSTEAETQKAFDENYGHIFE